MMDPISGFFEPIRNLPDKHSLTCIYRSGGWCEIWRGVRDGELRAYKCLKEPYRNQFLYQELLRKEFEICRNLSHPGIRRCYSLTELEGIGYCIEMEYVEGETLSDLLDRGALTPDQARTVTDELLDAVAYLHRNNIRHNDLKPSNILITRDGSHIKLIDFGLADTDSWTILKMKGGTPTYAAPEMRNEKGEAGSQASDIYSLGKILQRLGTVPPRIIRHCCSPNPKSRPSTVEQIQEALERKKRRFPWPAMAAVAALIPLLWFHGPVTTFVSSLFPVKNPAWGGLCVEAIEDGEITFHSVAFKPFEYSRDARHWIREDSLLTLKVRRRECIYFRANNNSYTRRKMENSRYSHFSFSAPCYIYGNMMSLIDSTGFDGDPRFGRSHNFARIFEDNPHLRLHPKKKLLLPATILTVGCYRWMFKGCTGITEAPALPATELKGYCYQSMFEGCTSLETPPELPATRLSPFCYASMFRHSGLREAPALPALTIPENAYHSMFMECSRLTEAPLLPATELGTKCYLSMFESCYALTTGPSILPATRLETSCYHLMFTRTALQKAPELPATSLANECYAYMFAYCSDLEQAPVLPAESLVEKCYMGMFQSCSRLSQVEVHATQVSAPECTTNWMLDTQPHGTLRCPAASPWLGAERSADTIPKGWEVQVIGE